MNNEKYISSINVIFSKNGNGYLSSRINLNKQIIEILEINENNKKLSVFSKNNEIILRKEEN